ncbi:MAG: 4-hydroxythreonine-4-phosphate dehydrogenase PdxA, partial [Planctomycetaceae bacterium]
MERPKIAITLGDVAGIGPEVVVRACTDPDVRGQCRPTVVGDARVLDNTARLLGNSLRIISVDDCDDAQYPNDVVPCWNPADISLADVVPGRIDARAGRAAYDFLVAATRATLADRFDAIVTAPINKAALRLAGINYPGHTEILAEMCGCDRFAMMLYLPTGPQVISPNGLGVAHVTLHTSLSSVPRLLSTAGVNEKIELLCGFMQDVGCAHPRIAVCALNPHAGEDGLFGDEERTIIAPAVASARESGIDASGPFPADTLLRRAVAGEFDGVVAM